MTININIDISLGSVERESGREAARGLADELRAQNFND